MLYYLWTLRYFNYNLMKNLTTIVIVALFYTSCLHHHLVKEQAG